MTRQRLWVALAGWAVNWQPRRCNCSVLPGHSNANLMVRQAHSQGRGHHRRLSMVACCLSTVSSGWRRRCRSVCRCGAITTAPTSAPPIIWPKHSAYHPNESDAAADPDRGQESARRCGWSRATPTPATSSPAAPKTSPTTEGAARTLRSGRTQLRCHPQDGRLSRSGA